MRMLPEVPNHTAQRIRQRPACSCSDALPLYITQERDAGC